MAGLIIIAQKRDFPSQAQAGERTPQQFLLDVIVDSAWLLQRSGLLSPGYLHSISLRQRYFSMQAWSPPPLPLHEPSSRRLVQASDLWKCGLR